MVPVKIEYLTSPPSTKRRRADMELSSEPSELPSEWRIPKSVVYLGTVTAEEEDHLYCGTFKKRYDGHTYSFRHCENRTDTI